MKRRFGLLSAWIPALVILCVTQAVHAAYADVPESALGDEVRKAAEYGLMNGLSDTVFGYSAPMTRAQFITALDRMLLSDAGEAPLPETMKLPDAFPKVHSQSLSHAVAREVVESSVPFRPDAPVTRQEMSEMLVRALGLNAAALSLSSDRLSLNSDQISTPALENPTPFLDLPEGKEGYAAIAYAVGMTKGLSETAFGPDATATRAQAAAMLTRVYEKLRRDTDFRHIFHAADAAYSALEIPADAVSVEWSRMTWNNSNAVLTTEENDFNERFIPSDYAKVAETVAGNGAELYLSVFMDASGGIEKLLASDDGREEAVRQILRELTAPYPALGRNPYGGVTIDFQGLHKEHQQLFTQFLSELRDALSPTGKGLYVCVAPYLSAGHWDDGYDCRAIANIADKIILTAYDYHAENLNNFLGTEAYKNEASAPLGNVYLSVWKLTEAVSDASKLVLDISFRPVAWEIGENALLLSASPVSLNTETLRQYLRLSDTERGWSVPYQMPYAVYTTRQGSRYFVWYENDRSVRKKTETARLLGFTGISYRNPLYALDD